MQVQGPRTYLTGAASIVDKRLVKLSGSTVIHNTATATDDPIGVTQMDQATSGGRVTVEHLAGDKTLEVTAAGAFSAGADLYAAADGKVQALPATNGTYRRVGKALETAAADGEIIEMLPYNDGATTTVSG